MNICVYIIAKLFYMHLNKKRDKEWNAMTEEVRSYSNYRLESSLLTNLQQRLEYLATTKDVGSSRKDFRFAH